MRMNSGCVIVALDFSDSRYALKFANKLCPESCALKVGKELFLSGGPKLLEKLISKQFKVFLDLKFHDIPNTVAKACSSANDLGLWMINVHALGGEEMLRAARESIPSGEDSPLLIAVTVLISLGNQDLVTMGLQIQVEALVNRLTYLAAGLHYDGVVCSALEAGAVKARVGSKFLRVTPGISLSGNKYNDQKRVVSPVEAIKLGASHLVIGRSINQSGKPMHLIDKINSEIFLNKN